MQVLALGLMGSPWLCTVGSSPFFFHYLPACTPASLSQTVRIPCAARLGSHCSGGPKVTFCLAREALGDLSRPNPGASGHQPDC